MCNKKDKLEKSIKLAKYRLKQFTDSILETEAGNIAYNRLLVDKAVMVHELNKTKQNKIKNLTQKIYRHVTNKKLICDSF